MTLKQQILELRELGYGYKKIASLLSCSTSTIAYHVSPDQREKNHKRSREFKQRNVLSMKLNRFMNKTGSSNEFVLSSSRRETRKIIKEKRYDFITRNRDMHSSDFSIDEAIELIGDNPKCYLTGDPIDLTDSNQYSFDHIIPASKGGDNSLANLGICLWTANRSKSDLTLEEYLSLCHKVLTHHGYKVTKD